MAATRTRKSCEAPLRATDAGSWHSMEAKGTRSLGNPRSGTVYFARETSERVHPGLGLLHDADRGWGWIRS